MRIVTIVSALALMGVLGSASRVEAQTPTPPAGQAQPWGAPSAPGYGPGYGTPAYGTPAYGTPGYGYGTPAPYTPPPSRARSRQSSEIEIGVLYGVSASYGVGLGMWFDSEVGIDDPGLQFIPPVVLGVAAPVGVYFMDEPPMDSGMPAAISAGLLLGAGEGLGVWALQFTTADESDAWGFRGLARASALGSTLGGAAGYAMAVFQEPDPETSVLLGSGAIWGGVIGSMIGYGATEGGIGFGKANDGASLGGLIGYNLGLGAAAAVSAFYVPSWENLGWMWIGGGIGAAAGLPVYLAYAGSDKPAKRGLIFQGITTGLGIAAAGIFTSGSSDFEMARSTSSSTTARGKPFVQLTGLGPMVPAEGGAGIQLTGTLW